MNSSQPNIGLVVNHPTADIYLNNDGYVWIKFKEKADLNKECAYEYIDIFEQICKGEKRGFILDTRGSRASTSQEFRTIIGNDPRAVKWRKADAMILNSLHKRMVGSFYMKFDTPSLPVKLFGTEEEAKTWLARF